MPKLSAGLLLFQRRPDGSSVFLVHPGGPFWRAKDIGAWSIPKGEVTAGEDILVAAKREFTEETGITADGEFTSLGEVKQRGGKIVTAWAVEQDCLPSIQSNTFTMEWPPKSGRMQEFPEVDRAEWFPLEEARRRILPGQVPFLDRLLAHLLSAKT
ncbi:MAG TPA: NUDIX domain-containing protein [Candidatus Saccharimonadales bacterium]|nr:NUDIX domain-containing protein [Candidatus Saccharimonadales bacterium]